MRSPGNLQRILEYNIMKKLLPEWYRKNSTKRWASLEFRLNGFKESEKRHKDTQDSNFEPWNHPIPISKNSKESKYQKQNRTRKIWKNDQSNLINDHIQRS